MFAAGGSNGSASFCSFLALVLRSLLGSLRMRQVSDAFYGMSLPTMSWSKTFSRYLIRGRRRSFQSTTPEHRSCSVGGSRTHRPKSSRACRESGEARGYSIYRMLSSFTRFACLQTTTPICLVANSCGRISTSGLAWRSLLITLRSNGVPLSSVWVFSCQLE